MQPAVQRTDTGSERDYAVPAVDRMLDIVEFLVQQTRPFGISELARALNIATNSVFRILRRLDARGYVEFDEEAGGYRLGTGFFRLGMRLSTRFDLRTRARPHLDWLARQTGETATIQIPDGDRLLVLDAANPPGEFFFHIVVGSRFYYHCNAMGKCVLAFLDEAQLRSILPARLPTLTPNTITDRKRLACELAEVRETGVGYDRQEYTTGVFCIGSPVFDVNQRIVAGVGISGLAVRWDEVECRRLELLVQQAAARICADTGYEGAFYAHV
jgi:DNA-binding IclR family transcriptional regulator